MNALALLCEAQEHEQRAADLRAQAAQVIARMRADGMTVAAIGDMIGVSKQRVSQLLAKADRQGWGTVEPRKISGGNWLQQQASEFQLARMAQEQRAEAASLGYSAEMAGFYGDPSQPTAEITEQRITWRDWISHSAQTA